MLPDAWRVVDTAELELGAEHFKTLARTRKAKHLARVLRELGFTADEARALRADGRRLVEKAADVDGRGPSSETTWGIAFVLLED